MRPMLGFIAALVLALAASGVILVLRNMASGTNNLSTAMAEVSTISGNVPPDLGGVANTGSITTAMVVRDKDAPSNMVSGTSLVDPWGGQVTVTPDASPGLFDINLAAVPDSACSKLVDGEGGFKTATINGSTVSTPIDAATVSQDCQSGSNSVTFAYVG